MLRSAAGAARVRGSAAGRTTRCNIFNNADTRGVQRQLYQTQQHWRRRCAATIAARREGVDTANRTSPPAAWHLRPPSYSAAATISRSGGSVYTPFNPSCMSCYGAGGKGGSIRLWAPQQHLRHLSTSRRGLRPWRSFQQKVFAGVAMAVLAALGLVFGATILLLLPFVAIGLFLLRRNFQRGGISKNLAAELARKLAELGGVRSGGGGGGGNFGPMMGGGGGGGAFPSSMQGTPTEGVLSSLLARMLGPGLRWIKLVGVLRSEVEKRALRHPGLSSAIGGGIEGLSGFEMSTVRYVGNVDDGYERGGNKRVVKARLRFSGKLAGPGGTGWAEVEATDWEGARGEEGRLEFDRIFVTLDNGRTFDLSSKSFSDDGRVGEEDGGKAAGFMHTAQTSSSSSSMRGVKEARGPKRSSRRSGGRDGDGDGQPTEAEFRDKR
ncbi:unnamed protein product [Pylaiella littoralis]